MVNCRKCDEGLAATDDQCPHCGALVRERQGLLWVGGQLVAMLVLAVIGLPAALLGGIMFVYSATVILLGQVEPDGGEWMSLFVGIVLIAVFGVAWLIWRWTVRGPAGKGKRVK